MEPGQGRAQCLVTDRRRFPQTAQVWPCCTGMMTTETLPGHGELAATKAAVGHNYEIDVV